MIMYLEHGNLYTDNVSGMQLYCFWYKSYDVSMVSRYNHAHTCVHVIILIIITVVQLLVSEHYNLGHQ